MTQYYFYPYIALTGGTDGALDSLDGSLLKNGDAAYVVIPGTRNTYVYTLDADSALAENSPSVISPDTNAGDKRWVITNTPTNENDVKFYGAVGDGATDDRDAIAAADAAVTGYLRFTPGTYVIDSNLTITNPIIMDPGSKFKVETGYTLTINGGLSAEPYPIFSGAGVVVGLKDVWANWFGALGDNSTDDTAAVSKAIVSVDSTIYLDYPPTAHNNASQGIIRFRTATYHIGALTAITEAITFDFNSSKIIPTTTGIMFTVSTDPRGGHVIGTSDKVIFRNGVVYGVGASSPDSVIKYTYLENYSILENFHIRAVTTTGATILHMSGYGLVVRDCSFSDSTTPAVFSLIAAIDVSTFSNAIVFDHVDIQDITGCGIYATGGDLSITNKSIIQGCSTGGVIHGGEAYMSMLSVSDSYFEVNGSTGAIDASGETTGTYGGVFSVVGCLFEGNNENHIKVGAKTILTVQGSHFVKGGIYGTVSPISYVGINNLQQLSTTGYGTTGTLQAELCTALLANAMNTCIINNYGAGKTGTWTPTVTATGGTFTTVSATGSYVKIGKTVHIKSMITITTNGSAAEVIRMTLPFDTDTGAFFGGGCIVSSGLPVAVTFYPTTGAYIQNLDGSYPGGTGVAISISGTYQMA